MVRNTLSKRTLSISEAQRELTRLPEQLEEASGSVTVTRHGKPVLTILPFSTYETLVEAIEVLQETLEVLQDEELMAAFRKGVKAMQQGEMIDWEDAKRELGYHEMEH